MNGPDIYKVFQGKSIDKLHHANTVTTSCSILESGGLASRGYVADRGLPQTPQYTDSDDRKYGIWNDVFVDTVDIHYRGGRMKGYNEYGPVLFVFDSAILNSLPSQSEVLVTKKNPSKWVDGEPPDARFFTTLGELEYLLFKGTFDQMVVVRTPQGILPFPKSGVSIVVDDPQRTFSDGTLAYAHAIDRIKAASAKSGTRSAISKHNCRMACICVSKYQSLPNDLFDRFFR